MPIKALKKVILSKIEGVYGTDPVPVAATDAMRVRNWSFDELKLNYDARALVQPFFGNDGQAVAGKFSQCSFDVEIAGSGVAGTAPKYGVLMKASAMSETVNAGVSVVYAPISTGEQSCTFYFYMDGQIYKMVGSRGTWVAKLEAGKIPVFSFTFVGLYSPVTDGAIVAPTLSTIAPLVVNLANTTPFTLHGYAAAFSSLSVDLGNQVKYRNLPNSEYVVFMDRAAKGSAMFEKPLIGTKDFYAAALAETSGVLTVTHGPALNRVVIAANQAVPTNPKPGEQDGIAMLGVDLDLKYTFAGNDELSVTVL